MPASLEFLSPPEPPARPVRKIPVWMLPTGVFAGFGLVLAGLYRDRLVPAAEVETGRVVAIEAEAAASGGGTLFQASGWLEPDPYPVKASALIDGVVASVQVLEGAEVMEGDLLVSLVDEDARLALAMAEARHRQLLAAKEVHLAAVEVAKRRLEALTKEVHAAETLESEAEDRLDRLNPLAASGAVSQSDAISARLRLGREQALRGAAEANASEIDAEVRRMELETREKDAETALAAVGVEQAQLALERTRILAPISGRVMRLVAAPGDKRMLNMDHPDSSTVCILYDPDNLQVRVDVPLADAGGLRVGQKAKIHSGLDPRRVYDGEVTRIAGEADLQRNTLQAKVRLIDPSDLLRPEMLCRVEFLADPDPVEGSPPRSGSLSLWVPAAALREGGVWVFDPETKRITRRPVEATGEAEDGHLRIAEGLRPGEQVVLSQGVWSEGQRVRPVQR